MIRKVFVGIDRDNTIHYDRQGYFGIDSNWKSSFEFCPGAVDGLRRLTSAENITTVVVTHQVGIAKGVLTPQRVEEVNRFINDQLSQLGVRIDSWQYNPFTLPQGARLWALKGVQTINWAYVIPESDPRSSWIKPGVGLLQKAAEELGVKLPDQEVFFIGDRATDVETGLNAGGTGILVNNPDVERGNSIHDSTDRVEEMRADPQYASQVYVVSTLIEAAEYVLRRSADR